MKQYFVIECDSELNSVFVSAVTCEHKDLSDKGVAYYRNPSGPFVICESLGPRLYGKLEALLVTRGKLEEAKPVEPDKNSVVEFLNSAPDVVEKVSGADIRRSQGISDFALMEHIHGAGNANG